MAHIETHAPGTFCWFELGTTDQKAAKEFYGALLGWTFTDSPMGPDGIYTRFHLDDRDTGGCYQLNAEMLGRGVPPHWMLYVSVSDADGTGSKVVPAGGTLVIAPFDVMDFGRMAVIQDPAGAIISFWQPKTHPGTLIKDVPGTFCWADLMTTDQQGAVKFYGTVFGWAEEAGKDDSGYLHIKSGDEYVGGILPPGNRPANVPPHWLPYMLVADCDASTAKAAGLGAAVHLEPMSMEGVGRWSVIADPQGAVLALFQKGR
jgi:predicted enzyme related to lactoylglutathione lyase